MAVESREPPTPENWRRRRRPQRWRRSPQRRRRPGGSHISPTTSPTPISPTTVVGLPATPNERGLSGIVRCAPKHDIFDWEANPQCQGIVSEDEHEQKNERTVLRRGGGGESSYGTDVGGLGSRRTFLHKSAEEEDGMGAGCLQKDLAVAQKLRVAQNTVPRRVAKGEVGFDLTGLNVGVVVQLLDGHGPPGRGGDFPSWVIFMTRAASAAAASTTGPAHGGHDGIVPYGRRPGGGGGRGASPHNSLSAGKPCMEPSFEVTDGTSSRAMEIPLKRTNMTAQEMVPDSTNPAHDPRYWCLPPVRDQPSPTGRGSRRLYLVTQGKVVGIWHNWTVVKAMVSGYSEGAVRGHDTMEGCVAEWQQHCALGVHPHPAMPANPETPIPDLSILSLSDVGQIRWSSDDTSITRTSSPTATSSASSVTASSWTEVPAQARYFALWGARVVYTDRGEARTAFLQAEEEGSRPRVLSSVDYDEAQAFAEATNFMCLMTTRGANDFCGEGPREDSPEERTPETEERTRETSVAKEAPSPPSQLHQSPPDAPGSQPLDGAPTNPAPGALPVPMLQCALAGPEVHVTAGPCHYQGMVHIATRTSGQL
ncbi:hypothetical protein B0H12DRAFT_1075226 [Mycena haematopus]|nr:hypothetical protein B0H12DRAFT_1075226 [Mycena haematopus]